MRDPRWPALVGYGVLAAPLAMLTGPVLAALPTFYVTELALAPAAVGLALLLARLWDALCDPLMGVLSDRSAAKPYGRLRWIILGTPLTLLGAGLMLVPPAGVTPVLLGLASAVLATGWTALKLNHDAIASEYTDDPKLRTRIIGIREALALLGGMAAILLLGWGLSGPGLGTALVWLFGILVLLLPASVICLRGTMRRRASSPATRCSGRQLLSIWRSSRALRQLAGAQLLSQLGAALPATLFLLYVSHVLARPDLQGPLILLYFLCALLGAPLWLRLARRNRAQAWRLSLLASALAFAPATLLGPAALWLYILVIVATGLCFAGDLILPQSLLADLADQLAAVHGTRPAGVLFAGLSTIGKLAYALAVGLAFPLLDLAGFKANQDGPSGLWLLALLYAGLPALLKLAAWWLLQRWRVEPEA